MPAVSLARYPGGVTVMVIEAYALRFVVPVSRAIIVDLKDLGGVR